MTVRQAEMLLAAIIAARATSFMFSKILVGTMAPFNILAVRFLIAAGLLIVLFHRRLLKLDRRTLGCGAAMGGVFFASMALEMHALTGASSSTVSFLENTAIVLVPMAAALMAWLLSLATETPPDALPAGAVGELIYLGVFSTALALLMQSVGQKSTPPAPAAILLSLESVFGVLFSVLFYGEVVTPRLAAGFALIFLAVLISETQLSFLRQLFPRRGRWASGAS